MVMALKLIQHPSNHLLVIAGYEGGFTAVHLLDRASGPGSHATANTIPESARTIYLSHPHSQPIMSLDASPDGKTYFTSSADAIIAAHRIPEPLNIETDESPMRGNTVQGNVSTARNSEVPTTITSTAESTMNMSEPEPLTFPKQTISTAQPVPKIPLSNSPSLLSAALSSSTSQPRVTTPADPFPSVTELQAPLKTVNTKHAGQQSLRVRSDGRILATGGWDSRIRVYSAKTLKEVAALKWHKEGVYAVGFGEVLDDESFETCASAEQVAVPNQGGIGVTQQALTQPDLSMQSTGGEAALSKLQRQREEKMQRKHWIAAGAKDGKVSLWEIY
jgi:WD40 repeat protein